MNPESDRRGPSSVLCGACHEDRPPKVRCLRSVRLPTQRQASPATTVPISGATGELLEP